MQQVKKMGPLNQVLGMLPGMNTKALENVEVDEKKMGHVEAIIKSMTAKERHDPGILNGSRRKRIAAGSGTTVQEVNSVLKQFEEMKKMMKMVSDMGRKGGKGLGKMRLPF
jgi:signal recognition particle subunit SRP54